MRVFHTDLVLFSSVTGTGIRGVVTSVQAGVSITLTANPKIQK